MIRQMQVLLQVYISAVGGDRCSLKITLHEADDSELLGSNLAGE